MGWLIAAAGAFTLTAAISDWDWFMDHYKARWLSKLLGRGGARIFYGVLGAGLLAGGVLLGLGVIEPPPETGESNP